MISFYLNNRVRWIFYSMSNSSLILKYFVIITSFACLVSIEVNVPLIIIQEFEAVSLIPSSWENIKWNLTSNWVSQRKIRESCLQDFNKVSSNMMLMIIFLEFVSLLQRTISPNRRNVNHSSSVLNECPSFHRKLDFAHVLKSKIHQILVLLFPNCFTKTHLFHLYISLVSLIFSNKSIFCEKPMNII